MNDFLKQSITDEALKILLAERSPWIVSWNVPGNGFTKSGTQKMYFIVGDSEAILSGRLSETSDPRIHSGPIKNISIKDGCVSFVSVVTGTVYNYCLTKDGILRGFLIGVSPQKYSFVGDAVARPANRRSS